MDIPSSATALQLLMLFIGVPLVYALMWVLANWNQIIYKFSLWHFRRRRAKEIKKWSGK